MFLALAVVVVEGPLLAQNVRCVDSPSGGMRAIACTMMSCPENDFRGAIATYHRAGATSGELAVGLHCDAARQLDRAILHSPGYDQLELARFFLAHSLEQCGYESLAAQILTEIGRVLGESRSRDGQPPPDCQSIDLLAHARFTAADIWQRLDRLEAAFIIFGALVEDARSVLSPAASVVRRDATLRYVDLGFALNRQSEVRRLIELLLARSDGSFGTHGPEFLRSLMSRLNSR